MEQLVKLLSELVGIPSVSGNELEISKFVKEWLEEQGIEVYFQKVEQNRYNIIAKTSGEGRKILVSAHLDTVAPVKGWTTNPYELRIVGEKAYGLGALDMKSGLAILMLTLTEFNRGDIQLVGVFTVDEELNSLGMYRFLEENNDSFYGALFTEPLPGNRIALVNRAFGRYAFDVSLAVNGGHAAFNGLNPIKEILRKLSNSLEKLQSFEREGRIGKSEFSLSKLEMGSDFLSIPPEVKLRLNYRAIEGDTVDNTMGIIREAFNNFEQVEVEPTPRPTPFLEPFYFDSSVEFVRKCLNIINETATAYSVFDGNLTAMYGIPTVNIGPIGENLHRANEYVFLPSLHRVYRIVNKILYSV